LCNSICTHPGKPQTHFKHPFYTDQIILRLASWLQRIVCTQWDLNLKTSWDYYKNQGFYHLSQPLIVDYVLDETKLWIFCLYKAPIITSISYFKSITRMWLVLSDKRNPCENYLASYFDDQPLGLTFLTSLPSGLETHLCHDFIVVSVGSCLVGVSLPDVPKKQSCGSPTWNMPSTMKE
jgi:hypothetical protein